MVLGFSLSGFTIPAGEGVLVILEISGSGNACILTDGLVVSSTTGTGLPASVEIVILYKFHKRYIFTGCQLP